MDDIFLYCKLIGGYQHSVTNSPLEDIAPTADNKLRQESCPSNHFPSILITLNGSATKGSQVSWHTNVETLPIFCDPLTVNTQLMNVHSLDDAFGKWRHV